MCLNVDSNYHPNGTVRGQAFIATQPILVYKRLTSPNHTSARAPYRGTRWVFGVTQKVRNFTYCPVDQYCVNAGLHAFFHQTAKRISYGGGVFPAVIPAGARFFIGLNGEIVSTELTVYRNQTHLFKSLGIKEFGAPIHRNTLTKRSR